MLTQILMWTGVSMAGTLLYIDEDELYVQQMNTRTFELTPSASTIELGSPTAGLAFDQFEVLWMHYEESTQGDLIRSLPPYTSYMDVFFYMFMTPSDTPYHRTSSIVFDPTRQEIIVFYTQPNYGVQPLFGAPLASLPVFTSAAAWDPVRGGFLFVDIVSRNIYSMVNYGVPQLVGTAPVAVDDNSYGMAYDIDLHILWIVTDIYGVFGLDPLTFEQVAWLLPSTNGLFGATSQNYDPVPDFEPELLVTGTCPGEVFVTAVDHTPGGQVKIFSGTRPGTLVSPPGAPCAGASLGMRNPVLRGTLTANSLGLASTKFQAPASMCGSWRFQAVDVSTCTPSSVRGLP